MTRLLGVFALCLGSVQATTLTRASLDELIQKSTSIVRGQVTGTRAQVRGSLVQTHVTIRVLERWKGADGGTVEVVLPGGVAGNLRQPIAGVPELAAGAEYVFFLWTGRSGVTRMLGLSQGVLDVARNAQGELTVSRGPVNATLVDAAGKVVRDESMVMRLSDFSAQVKRAVGGNR